ncbi:MAG TPA: NAD(P)-binding domain-containing protein [Gemmatimonadaceae bacterium]|jgi:predicted dinucleotide-binding enzyme|nr:NAD(P)-binding domain-containing protein [Gemmatimonadaceae bacterium]
MDGTVRIGILGTGVVGQTIGGKLADLGHDVKLGSRTATNEKAAKWVAQHGSHASQGTFADAASFGEIVFNCTSGMVSLEALHSAGAANLAGKVLVDVSNPLDFSHGMPPTLSVCNSDSIAEQIQRAFPDAKVVKTLNTTNAAVMVNPSVVPGDHDIFVSGNDAGAKSQVSELLRSFGWKTIIDLGDISSARGVEMLLPIWLRLMGTFKTATFNFHVARG